MLGGFIKATFLRLLLSFVSLLLLPLLHWPYLIIHQNFVGWRWGVKSLSSAFDVNLRSHSGLFASLPLPLPQSQLSWTFALATCTLHFLRPTSIWLAVSVSVSMTLWLALRSALDVQHRLPLAPLSATLPLLPFLTLSLLQMNFALSVNYYVALVTALQTLLLVRHLWILELCLRRLRGSQGAAYCLPPCLPCSCRVSLDKRIC